MKNIAIVNMLAMNVTFEYRQEIETIHPDVQAEATFLIEAEVEGDEVEIVSIKYKVPGAFLLVEQRVPSKTSMNREDNIMMGILREKARNEASRKMKQFESQNTE